MKLSRCLAPLSLAVLLAACESLAPAPVVERGKGVPSSAQAIPAKDLYTVKRGDTLYSIAQANGVDHRELAALNNIDNPSRIFVGQQLRLRAAAAPAASGVVTQPVGAGAPVVEQRSLDSAPAPAAAASPNTPQMKVEPQAGKEPYSEEALARAQRDQAGTAVVAKAEPRAEAKPEPKPEAKPETKPAADPSAGGDDVAWIWPANGTVIGQFSESGAKGIAIGGKAGDAVVAAGDGKVVYAGTGLRGYGQLIIVKHNATFLSAYAHNQKLLVKEGQTVSKGQKIAEMGNTDADQVKLHFEIRRQGKPVDPMKYLPQR
ncbi:MAG TPA: peptidoglycan DD-metalloendopeptidase family protein [Azospira sp.]|nr:peptidoglycan DD-metalloendopeptidase family protein [Azospira sp.]